MEELNTAAQAVTVPHDCIADEAWLASICFNFIEGSVLAHIDSKWIKLDVLNPTTLRAGTPVVILPGSGMAWYMTVHDDSNTL